MAIAEAFGASQNGKLPIDISSLAQAAATAGKTYATAIADRDDLQAKVEELTRQLLLVRRRRGRVSSEAQTPTGNMILHWSSLISTSNLTAIIPNPSPSTQSPVSGATTS
jgi:hypothetical protein